MGAFSYEAVNSSSSNASNSYHEGQYFFTDDEYGEYVYEAFDFERPIYLYIWEILVIITVLVNIVVIWILFQKRMRNVTNLILVGLAISDSLTGLVTLPTYIMVYQNLKTPEKHGDLFNTTDVVYDLAYDQDFYVDYGQNYNFTSENSSYDSSMADMVDMDFDAYILSKSLCEAFMISKFFLSKTFHTISIWLTMFLGIQRYIYVAYPFKAKIWFTTKNTLIICVVISLAAPVLHIYHLTDDKTVEGFCTWVLIPGSTVHLWVTLLLRHLIPCLVLTVTTGLFIHHLKKNSFSWTESREEDNRRISRIVIAVVVVFLIPEVPYGIFLLCLDVTRYVDNNKLISLKHNRAIHAIYELALVLSFHLNFYIYTFVNKRFRHQLRRTFVSPFSSKRRAGGVNNRAGSKLTDLRNTNGSSDTGTKVTEMKTLNQYSDSDSKGTELKSVNQSASNMKGSEVEPLNPSDTGGI